MAKVPEIAMMPVLSRMWYPYFRISGSATFVMADAAEMLEPVTVPKATAARQVATANPPAIRPTAL